MIDGSFTNKIFHGPGRRGAKAAVESLARSVGIDLDGRGPLSIRVLRDDFYDLALARGFTGLREAYVDGAWEADQLDAVTAQALSERTPLQWSDGAELAVFALWSRLRNLQSRARIPQSGRHYDLGNDLYAAMLDRRMMYSCAYWRGANDLDEAQEAKLDLVCRKLGLTRGMRVLDIGCGWGGFAAFAAERHGASVTGITISREQAALAEARCVGLPVSIRLQDYRDLTSSKERFDRIVSIGMFEHVGYKNYRRCLSIAKGKLAPDGLFLLHTIGTPISTTAYDPWMDRNIFPNALIPSAAQITVAAEDLFTIEDWHNIGADYDPTLLAWFENFDRAWPRLRERYGERFYRTWKCYLLTCAGAFRARTLHVWQIVLSPSGVRGGYHPAR